MGLVRVIHPTKETKMQIEAGTVGDSKPQILDGMQNLPYSLQGSNMTSTVQKSCVNSDQ